MTNTPVEFLEPKRDYAFMYSKIIRHVAAADALLTCNNTHKAAQELEKALIAIEQFENPLAMVVPRLD